MALCFHFTTLAATIPAGARIYASGNGVNVRETAGGPILFAVDADTVGVVKTGEPVLQMPVAGDASGTKYDWYPVAWQLPNGSRDGWTAAQLLVFRAPADPTLQRPGTPSESAPELLPLPQVAFLWAAASEFEASLTTDYLLKVRDLDAPGQPLSNYPITGNSHTLTLVPGHNYSWNVFARNADDEHRTVSDTRWFKVANAGDLVPWKRTDWPDKIVVSRSAGTQSADTIPEGGTAWVSFTVANQSDWPVSQPTYSFLRLNGQRIRNLQNAPWAFPSPPILSSQQAHSVPDFAIPSLPSGVHTLVLETGWSDAEGTVKLPGSDASNDEYSVTFVVGQALAPPSEVTATPSPEGITVRWRDNSADEDQFVVVRRKVVSGLSEFFTSPANSTIWNDTSAEPGADYCYLVYTLRGSEESARSTEACATRPAADAPFAEISGPTVLQYDETGTFQAVNVRGTGPLTFRWQAEGGTGSGERFRHKFPLSPQVQQTVTLVVTDAANQTFTATHRVTLTGTATTPANPGREFSIDPVNLATGDFVYEHVDLRMPGKGFGFEFKRSYNSRITRRAFEPFGPGWTHSYNIFLTNTGPDVLVTFGDGHVEAYFAQGDSFVPEASVYNRLTRLPDGWQLRDKRQTTLEFDGPGRLRSITDRNGNRLSLFYEAGLLARIVDTANREIRFRSHPAGLLSEIVDPLNRTNRFVYDEHGALTNAIGSLNRTNHYAYTNLHLLAEAHDPRGIRYVQNIYENGIVVRQCDAYTNWTHFAYDFANRITRQTNALEGVSTYRFDHRLLGTNTVDELGHSTGKVFDDRMNLVLEWDRNTNFTHHAYDTRGNRTHTTNALGGVTITAYDDRNDPLWQRDALTNFTYFGRDDRGNLTSVTNALEHVTRFVPDAAGQIERLTDARNHSTRQIHDAEGNLTHEINALSQTNRHFYDAVGRRTHTVDALHRTNRFVLDDADRLLFVVDALDHTNTVAYDPNGNRLATLDPRGAATTNFYDLKDRLTVVEDALRNRSTNRYDALDRLVESINTRGFPTRFLPDALGRITNVVDALDQTNRFTFDPNGNPLTATDPEGGETRTFYDALNRPFAVVDALGNTNLTEYDLLGRVVGLTNALGRWIRFRHDALGRLTNTTDQAEVSVSFLYDEVGNRLVTIDPNGHGRTNRYDELNRPVAIADFRGRTTHLQYDAVGNLTNRLTPRGIATAYRFNARNELTNIVPSVGSPVSLQRDAGGLITNQVDHLGVTSHRHDLLGRLEHTTDPFGQTVESAYDEAGNRVLLRYPGGKQVGYRHDEVNRIAAFTNWLSAVPVEYRYDRRGRVTNTVNANGTWVTAGHDDLSRLTTLTNFGPGGTVIAGYRLAHDALGNLTNRWLQEPLVPIVRSQTNHYSHDEDNRLVSINGVTVAHDDNGNLTGYGDNSLVWDEADRLIAFRWNGRSGSAEYDGLGLRLSLTVTNVTRRFVQDRVPALTQMLMETDDRGQPLAYYVYGLGLAQRIAPDGTVLTYHFDPHGSTVTLTGTNGATMAAQAYLPTGELADAVGDCPQPFRYQGKYGIVDDGTGLYFARARYWIPELGRFASLDPLTGTDGNPQSLNRYPYALNNPFRYFDPSGLEAKTAVSSTQSGTFIEQDSFDWVGLLPFFGSLRDAKNACNDARWFSCAFHATIAASDIVAIKAVAIAGGKLLIKVATKEGAEIVTEGIVNAITPLPTVDQYALKAVEDGFYPVMKRGFVEPQGVRWMNAGDVWKYGTTKNPTSRYTQSFLDKFGLRYEQQMSGTLQDALSAEKENILKYLLQNGMLPPGNKIIR